jgi:hypothetical protein
MRNRIVKKYRKLPVEILAMRFTGDQESISEANVFCGKQIKFMTNFPEPILCIKTLEGEMNVRPGDYIVKGTKDECYPVKPDIFESIYEEVV